MPNNPTKPETMNQAAAGTGTAEAVVNEPSDKTKIPGNSNTASIWCLNKYDSKCIAR